MHTYYVWRKPVDIFNGVHYSGLQDRNAENIDNLRRTLIKENERELTKRRMYIQIYIDHSHYVMSEPMGHIIADRGTGTLWWVTNRSSYILNKDGTLGERHKMKKRSI